MCGCHLWVGRRYRFTVPFLRIMRRRHSRSRLWTGVFAELAGRSDGLFRRTKCSLYRYGCQCISQLGKKRADYRKLTVRQFFRYYIGQCGNTIR